MQQIVRTLRTRWVALLAWWSTRRRLLVAYDMLVASSSDLAATVKTQDVQHLSDVDQLDKIKVDFQTSQDRSTSELKEAHQSNAVLEGRIDVMQTQIEGLGLVIEDLQEIRKRDIASNVARRMQSLRDPPQEDLVP